LAVFSAGVAFREKHKEKGMLSMPVLDAKALEIDPQGMAFLRSVLRQKPVAPSIASKVVSPRKELPQPLKMRLRLGRRAKDLISSQA
jgi:hypothetical protein